MIWSVSWRNIWRNPVRSGVIITAIAIGMFAGVFSGTFMKGWINQRLEAGVETEVSLLQLHHPKFRDNYDMQLGLPDGVNQSNEILSVEGVDGTSPRLMLQSMVSSAEAGTGIKIAGVLPDRERRDSKLPEFLREGDYFESVTRNPAVVGAKLAAKLKIKLHSKVVITLQDLHGNITSGAFRVCGIFDTGNDTFEESVLFVKYDDLLRLTGLPEGTAHEIAVHLSKPDRLNQVKNDISARFPETEVLTWKEISPELGYLTDIGDLYSYLFVVIILLALGFGIVNTMLMSVLERVKELGMLMAVGMSKTRIFVMLMLETVLLTFTGGIIGIVLGLAATLATAQTGIDLSMYALGLEDIGYAAIIKPSIEADLFLVTALLVIVTGIAASIYPARKALKYRPAEAIRIDM